MTQAEFIEKVYGVAFASNPDLDEASSFQEILKELTELKDKAMRWEILTSSFKPEPELFPVRQTLKDARARQAEQRQGQL